MFCTTFFHFVEMNPEKTLFFTETFICKRRKNISNGELSIFWPHPWEPISMNFPLQKTDRKNLVYFSIYPWFITFFVNREIMTFEVVKMTSYNGGVKLWEAVKSVLEEIFPNPLAWWKSRLIPFIKAKVAFFENSPRPERVKVSPYIRKKYWRKLENIYIWWFRGVEKIFLKTAKEKNV